jgi:hypothetical protein
MGRCSGRAWAHAAFVLLCLEVFAGGPSTAFSQEGEEVIADPELAGGSGGRTRNADGDEAISDPELGGSSAQSGFEEDYGWGAVYTPKTSSQGKAPPPEPEEDEYDPLANTGIGKLQVIGQQVFDTVADNALEDFYETRLRFGGEVDLRISRKLRVSFGTRLDFLWAAPHQNDPSLLTPIYGPDDNPDDNVDPPIIGTHRDGPLDQDRYEVDIIPLSAYADWTAREGLHLRLGVQPTSLGRMDGFSVTDMLVVLDMRPAPRVDPAALRISQPALRLDWDLSSWATLQAIYVPWFMPHFSRPNRDQYQQDALTGTGLNRVGGASAQFLDPSYQTIASDQLFRLVGPPPDFSSPQFEARLNFRGTSYEFAILGGSALEKLPAIYFIPELDQLMRGRIDGGMSNNSMDTALLEALASTVISGAPIIDVEYPRYHLVGVDGSFDIAPVQIGFEFAYSPGRLLFASTPSGASLPLPNVSEQICNPNAPMTPCANDPDGNVLDKDIRKGVPMLLAALHVEWLEGETFALFSEAYFAQALQMPYDRSRDWLGAIPNTGLYAAGIMTAAYRLDEGRWHLELSALLAPGPSAMLAPHVELRVVEGFYLNVGAQFYTMNDPILMSPGFAPRNITMGGLYDRYDNIYVGFRWLP